MQILSSNSFHVEDVGIQKFMLLETLLESGYDFAIKAAEWND
jgi:hypothetical protein